MDPRVKTVACLLYLVSASVVPPSRTGVLTGHALLLLCALLVCGIPAKTVCLRILPFASMAVLALAGIYLGGQQMLIVSIAVRALLDGMAVLILTETTSYSAIINSLAWMKMPSTIVALLLLAQKMASVFRREAIRMSRAYQSRGGRSGNLRSIPNMARLTTALFARAVARGERIAWAMTARGFNGTMPCQPMEPFYALQVVEMAAIGVLLLCIWRVNGK